MPSGWYHGWLGGLLIVVAEIKTVNNMSSRLTRLCMVSITYNCINLLFSAKETR